MGRTGAPCAGSQLRRDKHDHTTTRRSRPRIIATEIGNGLDEAAARELCARVHCPVLVIQGTADVVTGPGRGIALAEAAGGDLVLLEGSGHGPHVRDPVTVNLLLRDFAAPARTRPRWVRGPARAKRALYISSPIGLGHAQRDVAIAWFTDFVAAAIISGIGREVDYRPVATNGAVRAAALLADLL